jgi:hypothetical protein
LALFGGIKKQKKKKRETAVYTAVRRVQSVLLLLPWMGRVFFSGEVCGGWYYCDSSGF